MAEEADYNLELTTVALQKPAQTIHPYLGELNQQLIQLGEIGHLKRALFMPYQELSAPEISSDNMSTLRYGLGEVFYCRYEKDYS